MAILKTSSEQKLNNSVLFILLPMEYFSNREKQQLELIEKKPILEWTEKDWKIRNMLHDLETLEEISKLKNQTIYTILRRVSSNGMSRIIDMFYVSNEKPIPIHFYTDKIFKKRIHSSDGMGYRVGGCGMDMGFDLVSSLSYTISQFLNLDSDSYFFKQEWF